jgi:uncharacterized protein YgiM (DUF1202 family)
MVAFFALLPAAALAADAVYVQSAKAKIMGEPSFKSKEVGTARKGDKLAVAEKGDGWLKVSAGGMTGWVNKLVVSDSPPMDKVSVITEESADIGGQSRKRASAQTSAAAARGLSDTERKRLTDEGKADYRALTEMEKIAGGVSERDVESFSSQEVKP